MIVKCLTMVEDVIFCFYILFKVIPLVEHAMVAIQILYVIISMTLINVKNPIAHACNA
jgi:hypothetical protein